MQDRQREFVNDALLLCKQRDIDFLLHSDADELLYVQPNALHATIPKYLQLRIVLSQLPSKYDNIHMDNYEALYPTFNKDTDDKCFLSDRYRRCWEGKCVAYANGKSIARVQGRGWRGVGAISAHGPHWFSGLSYDYTKIFPVNPELAILHFDSCTFEQWEEKFWLLREINSTTLMHLPFPFYRKSITLQQSRERSMEESSVTTQNKAKTKSDNIVYETDLSYQTYTKDAIKFYQKEKVDTYYTHDYYLFKYWDGTEKRPSTIRNVDSSSSSMSEVKTSFIPDAEGVYNKALFHKKGSKFFEKHTKQKRLKVKFDDGVN